VLRCALVSGFFENTRKGAIVSDTADCLVPKVHPLAREAQPDDPVEIVASPVPGDPALMLECIVDEYAQIGWDANLLTALFRSPEYPVLNELLNFFGPEETRRRIDARLNEVGVFRVTETIAEDESAEEHEPELVPITIRTGR
jgi:hypothetical protein